MATPDINTQLTTLGMRLGDSTDATQARWSAAQLLALLGASRNEIAERTRCFQVKDSIAFTVGGTYPLPTSGNPFIVSLTNNFIWLEQLEWDGRPLRLVRAQDWRDVVGDDDTINDDPTVFMFFGRQLQIFGVPAAGATLLYRGWAYPDDIVAGGADASFTARAADVAIWHAAMVGKGLDERSTAFEEKMVNAGIAELRAQYMPRGPRYVRNMSLRAPRRPVI